MTEYPVYMETEIEVLKRTIEWCRKQNADNKIIDLLKKRIKVLKQEINFMYG